MKQFQMSPPTGGQNALRLRPKTNDLVQHMKHNPRKLFHRNGDNAIVIRTVVPAMIGWKK